VVVGAEAGGARRATGASGPMTTSRATAPDPEVSAKPERRRFSAEYRLRILKQADACKKPGELGALLRREGLYSSLLTNWRRQRDDGALREMRGRRRGPTPRPVDPRVKQLEAENRRLQRKLQRAETIITLQKNHRARQMPRSLLDQKLPGWLSSQHPGRSGRLLFGDASNP
ncbi:MAG: transposase, partial [Actinobacteria bacterium]|nr:transposase [Actinomycetota bacterium]